MPLQTFENTDITVEISDKVIGETVIKRKAELVRMEYSTLHKYVKLIVQVRLYAKEADGSYGEELNSEGFTPYQKPILADQSVLVNALTGEIIGSIDDLEIEGVDDEGGKLHGVNYMKEFEFYKMVAATKEVNIDQMIMNKIQWAASVGRL